MENQERGLTIKPCYAPYRTVVNTFTRWKETTVPSRVDISVLSNMSGAMASAVKISLVFLGLIEPDGTTGTVLKHVVDKHGTDEWQTLMAHLISVRYRGIVGNLDLDNGTAKQLEDRFAATGIQGSTRRKAIRFYLDAQRDAGVKVSPHFKPPKVSASTGKRKPKTSKQTPVDPPRRDKPQDGAEGVPAPDGYEKVDINIPGRTSGFIALFPENLTAAEWKYSIGHLQAWWDLKSTSGADMH